MCFAPQPRALFRHLNLQKWRTPSVLYILTWKCASRHKGVHFFDISTSKSAPTLRCFVPFHLEMRFAPQRRALFRHLNFKSGPTMVCFVHFDLEMNVLRATRRALFRHLNFQKWSEPLVFLTFWLRNVLRATTAWTFRHLNFQKCSEAEVLCTFSLGNVLRGQLAPHPPL